MRETVDGTMVFSTVLGWIPWTNTGLMVLFPRAERRKSMLLFSYLRKTLPAFRGTQENLLKISVPVSCALKERWRNTQMLRGVTVDPQSEHAQVIFFASENPSHPWNNNFWCEEPNKFLHWSNVISKACTACYPVERILWRIRAATSPVVKQWQKLFLGEDSPTKTFAILVNNVTFSDTVPLT